MSAEESDSSIDWDQPDTAPSEKHGSFSFRKRHNERIEAKIENTRAALGVFNQVDLGANRRSSTRCESGWRSGVTAA